jgi:hypothetical protein
MQTGFKSARMGQGRRGQGTEVDAQIAELGKRFARFRAEHPRGTRIPLELRDGVVALVEQGAGWRAMEQACGVSWGQIKAWQAVSPRRRSPAPGEGEEVRVFSVLDAQAGEPGPTTGFAGEETLELRLGPWSVSLRLVERARGGGGGA